MEVFCYFLNPKKKKIRGEDQKDPKFHKCSLREIRSGVGDTCGFSTFTDDYGLKFVSCDESSARTCPCFIPESDEERAKRLMELYKSFFGK